MNEVKRSTGYRKPERYADGLAIGMYPSTGCLIEGFEIKVAREDLLSELRQPEKAEAIKRFCDRWWLVVSDKEILAGKVRPPDDWGIMVANSRFITVEKIAEQLKPEPVDRYFLASLLRNFKTNLVNHMKSHIDEF